MSESAEGLARRDFEVRPGTREDVPRAVRTLGRAFADYAFTRHVIAADDHLRRVERFQELFIDRIGLDHGSVWVAGDGDAVAVWTTPRTADAGAVFAELESRFAELAGDRFPEYQEAEAAMATHRPQEPAWFLGSVGVDSDRQGRGLGGAVIRPGLDAADREGVLAFLETSEPRNVAFYEKLGFEVTAEYVLPGDGPRTWSMTRQPVG